MSSSFPFVQAAKSIGPYTGAPTATFSADVAYGDLIVVFWMNGNSASPGVSSVTDSAGNTYVLYSQSAGGQHNVTQITSSMFVAMNVSGGAVTVTVNGAPSETDNRQALIIAEYEAPITYQILGVEVDTSGNDAVFFTGLGTTGGETNNPGPVELSLSAPGSANAVPAMVAVALINQFSDVCLVAGFYLNLSSDQTDYPWTFSSSGAVRETTQQPSPTWGSAALADQDFPYLLGNLTVDCNNPPNGQVGTAYDHFLGGYGGSGTYTFSIIGGSLPPGLSLNATTGEISGTPTAAGRFNFTVGLSDSNGDVAVPVNCIISICAAGGGLNGNFVFSY